LIFSKWLPLPWKWPKCEKFEKHKNYHSRAYLVPLDVVVTRNITAKICEVWSEFNIFCTLVTMATAAILNFFNPRKLPHTTVDITVKSMEMAKMRKIRKTQKLS
jgi:hypothetical protein